MTQSSRTAYLIVGMTAEYHQPPWGKDSHRAALPHIIAAVREARARDFVLAYGARVYYEDGTNLEFMRRVGHSEIRQATGYYPAQHNAPLTLKWPEEIAPRPNDLVIPRRAFSSFFMTDLAIHLRQLGVERIVIAGGHAQTCVTAHVFDALSWGFRVAVHADGLGEFNAPENVHLEQVKNFFSSGLRIPLLSAVDDRWTSF